MRNLAIWAIAIIVAFIFLTITTNNYEGVFDPYILGLTGGTMLASAIVMLAYTRIWNIRAIGVFSITLGVSVLMLGTLLFRFAPSTLEYRQEVTNLFRALMGVGGPVLLAALVIYINRAAIFREDDDEPM